MSTYNSTCTLYSASISSLQTAFQSNKFALIFLNLGRLNAKENLIFNFTFFHHGQKVDCVKILKTISVTKTV